MKKESVALIGVGMMGGSLGRAIRKRKLPYRVVGIGRNLTRLKKAKKFEACDEVTVNLREGVENASIVVICTPVHEIVPQIKKILPYLKPNAVVTDIGSVKYAIVEGVLSLQNPSLHFIGSHPLAGSEKTGVENSNADLYQGAAVVLTPLKHSNRGFESIKKMWESLGARVLIMEPEIHDILVAQTSHLPHLLAGAFVQQISSLQKRDRRAAKLLAGSFKDFTRISDSDPRQWAEICQTNQKFVVGALKSYRDILARLIQNIESSKNSFPALSQFFSVAKEGRESLLYSNKL